MEYLIGLLMLVVGALFYTRTKQKTAEARNENLEVKEEALKLEKENAVDYAKIEAEKQKQAELAAKMEREKLDNDTKEILDLFNKFINKP